MSSFALGGRKICPQIPPTCLLDDDAIEFLVDAPIKRVAPAKEGSRKILFREHASLPKFTNISGPPDEVRLYGFTDGPVTEMSAGWLKASNLGSFDDWEQKHQVSNP